MADSHAFSATARAPFNDADADIVLRSADGVDFCLHKVMLRKVSPVFQDMFSLPPSQSLDDPQVVSLTEDGKTLEAILRYCYPVERPKFKTLDGLVSVLEAARKYDMPSVVADLRDSLRRLLSTSPPLRSYALAYIYELPDIARAAAKLLLQDPHPIAPATMPPELRILPSEALYAFAVYRKRCVEAALEVVDDVKWLISGHHKYKVSFSRRGNPNLDSTWVWLSCEEEEEDCAEDRYPRVEIRAKSRKLFPRLWWSRYISHVYETLAEQPSYYQAAAADSTVAKRCLEEAEDCPTCSEKARKHLTDFSFLLMERLEEAIDEVKLVLPF